MQQNRTPVQYSNLAYKEPIEKYVDGVHVCISPTRNSFIGMCSKWITQKAHTKLRKHSSRIFKNGTRVETWYVEICT